MKLQFAGVGSAFAGVDQYQTNAVVTGESGKKLLIDCGSDARFSLPAIGVTLADIDAVYITHLHADHIGGLEWLAFCTFFNPNLPRPKLYMVGSLMRDLWNRSLRGGLDSIEGKVMNLTDYFECIPVPPNGSFVWDGVEFEPLQTVHVMAGMKIVHSYGLVITFGRDASLSPRSILYTGDTQFCPHQITKFYDMAEVIFQDCETADYKSGVHANYADLCTLPEETKRRMWLMHYQVLVRAANARKDGFAGFVQMGQVFEFPPKEAKDEDSA